MKASKRKRLEAAGWAVGSADEFLGLSPVESLLVELRIALSQALRERRAKLQMSQTSLAGLIQSSQSRVAKMEAADPAVSFELLLRGLFATGATRRDVAIAVDQPKPGKKLAATARVSRRPTEVKNGAGKVAAGRARSRGRSRQSQGSPRTDAG